MSKVIKLWLFMQNNFFESLVIKFVLTNNIPNKNSGFLLQYDQVIKWIYYTSIVIHYIFPWYYYL